MANPALVKTANGIGLLVNGVVIDPAGASGVTPQLITATFTAVDNVALTWSNLGGNQYIHVGTPIVTDGGGGVVFHLTSKTSTGATLNASAPWTGTVAVAVFSL